MLHFKRVSRAAARGRGPSKQASEIPFLRLQELSDAPTPLSHLGPCHPRRFAVVSAWWMLREIEASNLTVNCITLEESAAHILLPASKTDPSGTGTSRTLCCTCSSTPSSLCPFHVLELQWQWASSLASSCPTSPLFPTTSGLPATKKCVVETICCMAKHLGLAEQTNLGAPRFTGHTFRVTGAMWMASSGIDIWRIQLHGRWASSAVLKYVPLAPLARSLSLEVSLGRDLSHVRVAIIEAKATSAGTQAPSLPLQNT